MGDAFHWGPGPFYRQRENFGSPSSAFLSSDPSRPYSSIAAVHDFFCNARRYCGRDSGLPGPVGHGDVNRWFMTANFAGCREGVCNTSHYSSSLDRIFLTAADTTEPDVIAHESGHVIDEHFQDDWVKTRESSEVDEALGDMFSYDYSYKQVWPGTKRVAIGSILATPNLFTFSDGAAPQKMSQYKCDAKDVHFNGHILSHAYWKWIESMNAKGLDGRTIAGNVLQSVPWQLAGQRTFGDTRNGFNLVIRAVYGTSSPVFDAYVDGFGTETNILFKHSRSFLGCSTI
jgi:hypothetical protein